MLVRDSSVPNVGTKNGRKAERVVGGTHLLLFFRFVSTLWTPVLHNMSALSANLDPISARNLRKKEVRVSQWEEGLRKCVCDCVWYTFNA